MNYKVFNIKYDTDGIKVNLPTEMVIYIEPYLDIELEFEISELISEKTSYLVESFQYELIQ